MHTRLGLVFLALTLAACAGASPGPSPTVPSITPTAIAVATASPRASAPPAIKATLPAAATAAQTAPTPTAAESPWPAFLRQLDFSIPAGNSYGPRALAVHPALGRLYARTHTQGLDAVGQVVMIDLNSGQVLAVVETGPDSFSDGDLVVDDVLDRVYALNPGDQTCSVLDADGLQPVAVLPDVDRLALDQGSGRLYLAGPASLRVLDAKGYGLLATLPLSSEQQVQDLAVDPVSGRLYAALGGANGYLLTLYDAPTLQVHATLALPAQPHGLLPDPARGRLYLTLDDGGYSSLWTLDSEGRLLEQRQLGEWMQETHLALDPQGGRLFVGREAYGHEGITILDLKTGRESGDIPLQVAPNALAWDPGFSRLLASHTYAQRISVVDVETAQVAGIFATALELVDLAVDPARGYLYATDTGGHLHVLDSDTDRELAVLHGEGRISLDIPHGRFYTGGLGADRVRTFDAGELRQTGEILTTARPVADAYHGSLYLVKRGIYLASLEAMTITTAISDTLPQSPGFSPNPAATDAVIDPASGRILAIIDNGIPGSNGGTYLYAYEPETYQKVLTDTERSPFYLDLDPDSGRAYVSRIHMTSRSTSLLEDGREYTARLEGVFGALRVDPALDRVYLTVSGDQQGQMLILDAGTLHVLGSVPIPGGYMLHALDPERHLLYLTGTNGQVQIWSATGGELPAAADPAPADLAATGPYELDRPPGDGPLFARDREYHLYRSDDGGRSWGRIGGGLPDEWALDVGFSPDFERDGTLFVALATADQGFGIWKSTDRGRSWRMTSVGLTDLAVTELAISPAFGQDQTLFATARQDGLFRSTDGGQSWVPLTERYYPPDPYPRQPGILALSPTYAQDHTLFVNHGELYRSTDGGDTWTSVFPGLAQLAFSPDYATDGTLYGWSGSSGVLRSTDRGDSWQAASAGLALQAYGAGQVIVSPDAGDSRTLYFLWTPSQSGTLSQIFRSTDAAATWERLVGEPPQAATPLEMSAGGEAFVALDASGRLARWPLAGLDWERAAPPLLGEIDIEQILMSSGSLFAVSGGAGILRSDDGGSTWADTGFPVRVTYGEPLGPGIAPPDTLLVGTALGLYRSRGRQWDLVGGGLPAGIAVSGPAVSGDGALRVLAGGQRIYLSTDGGQTWTQPVPDLPYPVQRDDILFSPAFATDHTAYVGLSWEKPWRTLGQKWEEFGPPGEWNLSGLYLSPAFDGDSLLLLLRDNGSLWRSTDRGDTWTEIRGPWEGDARLDVTFSAAYAQDGVLLAWTEDALYRSTDQGAAWTKVLGLAPHRVQILFSPDYADSGVIYLLQGQDLYRSTERGWAWAALPAAPWGPSEVSLQLSPTWPQDNTLLAWQGSGQVFQSSDGGQSWRDVSSGFPATAIRQVLFSPHYASDGLIYVLPHGGGLYKRVGDNPWLPATEE